MATGHTGSKHQTKFLATAHAGGEARALEDSKGPEWTGKAESLWDKLSPRTFSKQFSSAVMTSMRARTDRSLHKNPKFSWASWYTPTIPAFRQWMQEY